MVGVNALTYWASHFALNEPRCINGYNEFNVLFTVRWASTFPGRSRNNPSCFMLHSGVARIFQPAGGGGGGGGGRSHTVSHPGYLHCLLQMFGPANGVCNYLALEKINGMLILRVVPFSPAE